MNKIFYSALVCLVVLTPKVQAQSVGSSVKPSASVVPARSLGDSGIARSARTDSVATGGAGHSLLNSSVSFDVCLIDPNQAGCSSFCAANPSLPVCDDNAGSGSPIVVDGDKKVLRKSETLTHTDKIPIGSLGGFYWILDFPVGLAPNLDPSKVNVTVDSIRLVSGCAPDPNTHQAYGIYWWPYPGFGGNWTIQISAPISELNRCVGRGNFSYQYTYTVRKIVAASESDGGWTLDQYVGNDFSFSTP